MRARELKKVRALTLHSKPGLVAYTGTTCPVVETIWPGAKAFNALLYPNKHLTLCKYKKAQKWNESFLGQNSIKYSNFGN